MDTDKETDRGRGRDSDADDDSAPASKGDLARAKLKLIAHYAMLGFAPVVSVIALIFAVLAVTGGHPDQTQLSESVARMDSLNARLSETKAELENIRFAISREKNMLAEERKKEDEQDTKIIQDVTRLQVKLKVSPTLEEQLRVAASVPAVAASVSSAVSAPAATTASTVTEKKPAAAVPVTNDKKHAASVSAPKDTAKTSAQTKALRDAIEKFNK